MQDQLAEYTKNDGLVGTGHIVWLNVKFAWG